MKIANIQDYKQFHSSKIVKAEVKKEILIFSSKKNTSKDDILLKFLKDGIEFIINDL